jgi:hypothetical protein
MLLIRVRYVQIVLWDVGLKLKSTAVMDMSPQFPFSCASFTHATDTPGISIYINNSA